MSNKIYLKDVVYGGTIESIIYAHLNDFFFVPDGDLKPKHLEFIDPGISRFLGFEDILSLKTEDGEIEMGCFALDVWSRLYFNMSMMGRLVPTTDIQCIRLEEDHIRITHNRPYFVEIYFENLHIFSEQNLLGLPTPIHKEPKIYRSWDWANIKQGFSSEVDYYEIEDGPFERVFFYPSERWDGFTATRKDICIVSIIEEDKINDFEFSDTYFRLVLERIINKSNISSPIRDFSVESRERELEVISRDIYPDTDKITYIYDSLEDIVRNHEIRIKKIVFGRYHSRRRTRLKF